MIFLNSNVTDRTGREQTMTGSTPVLSNDVKNEMAFVNKTKQ